MNFKKTALLGLTVTCLLLALTGCGSKSESAEGVDSPFADMKTVDIDGNEVDSSIFADNTLTLVNVWNLGCTPCVEELPHLDKLNDELEGVAVVGLYYTFGQDLTEEDRAGIQALYDENGADYLQILASADMMQTKTVGQVQAFPTTFFVDSEGNIVDSKLGSRDYEGWKELAEAALEKLEG